MAAASDNNGPARRPVRIPPLSTIIAEGNLEIGRQVREAVERAVTAGIAVDPARLRRWGSSGADYFAKTLRERIMPPAQKVPPKLGGRPLDADVAPADAGTPKNAADVGEPLPAEPVDPPRRPYPVITMEKDWTDKEQDRWSIATRAFARGMLIAVSLLSLTIMVLRTWF
jgi:hypothetical protein